MVGHATGPKAEQSLVAAVPFLSSVHMDVSNGLEDSDDF